MKDDKFLVTRQIGLDFDAFRKKKRKGKFPLARKYFEQFKLPTRIPMKVRITEKLCSSELEKYHDFMAS